MPFSVLYKNERNWLQRLCPAIGLKTPTLYPLLLMLLASPIENHVFPESYVKRPDTSTALFIVVSLYIYYKNF
jgi:hypothetical protein